MSAAANPDIVTDGLVFKYDTGDGKSYRGEPTENLVPSGDRTASTALQRQSYHQETWSYSLLTNTLGRADIIRLYINPSGNTSQPYADFGFNAYKSGGSQVGDVYSISFDYYVAKNTNTPSCIIAYQNGYKSPSSASIATLGSETTVDLGGGWKRVTRTATITTAGTTWWRFGLSSDNNETEVYVDNFQVELKSHATPFVDGTRSATQGLLDRTGNSTIDLSNVSFDSNAQKTFDGTDDFIDTGYSSGDIATPTLEAVVYRSTSTGRYEAIIQNNVATDDALYVYPAGYLGFWPCTRSSLTVPTGQWSHIAVSYDGTNLTYIVNGTIQVVTATCSHITDWDFLRIGAHSTGDSERWIGEIAVVKVYNRALTASELLSNYRHYKNRFGI